MSGLGFGFSATFTTIAFDDSSLRWLSELLRGHSMERSAEKLPSPSCDSAVGSVRAGWCSTSGALERGAHDSMQIVRLWRHPDRCTNIAHREDRPQKLSDTEPRTRSADRAMGPLGFDQAAR